MPMVADASRQAPKLPEAAGCRGGGTSWTPVAIGFSQKTCLPADKGRLNAMGRRRVCGGWARPPLIAECWESYARRRFVARQGEAPASAHALI